MSREVDRLQVVIEGDNKKLKQSAQESKKVVQDLAKSTDSVLKQVRTNPLRDALKSDPAADGWRKQLDAVKSTVRQSMAQVDATRSVMRNFMIEAKLQAGLIRPTDAYKQVTEDIRSAEEELARLREQEKTFPDADKYAESERFVQIQKAAENSRKELEKLQAQLEKLDAAGKSVTPTTEYQEVDTQLTDAQNRLNALLEKQKSWKTLGFDSNDGGAMQSLKADIEEVTKEISYLKGEIKDLEDTGKAVKLTPEAQELENKISKASEALAKYEATCEQMKEDGTWQAESQKYHAVTSGIEEATSKLKQYKAEKLALEGSRNDYTPVSKGFSAGNDFEKIGAYASAAARKIRAMKETVAETVRQIPVLGRVVSNAAYLGSKAFGAMQAAAKKVAPAIKKVSGAAASLIKRFANGIPILRRFQNGISGAGNAAGRSSNEFRHGLRSLLLYGIGMRAVYAVVNTLRSALSTGLTSLAQYSSTTNANLSLLKSQLNQLQGAFASAFAPILNVVTPALSTLIDYLISACNAVAQFMAALTGQSTYTIATRGTADVANGANAVASSTGKAADNAEKLKRTLMSFDEINKLDDTSSQDGGGTGGGGGGGGAGIGFETQTVDNQFKDLANQIKKAWADADFTEIGELIGKKLKAGLDSVPWDKIKGTAAKIGKSLATLINGFVETSGLDDSIGKTVGELLNTGVSGTSAFMKNLHWESVGSFIAGSMNSFIRTADWSGAGKAVRDGINGVFKTVKTWSQEFDFEAAGNAIKQSLNSTLRGIKWSDAITASSNIGKGIADALNKVLTPGTFESIGSTVAGAVNTVIAGAYSFVSNAKWSRWGTAVASGINQFFAKLDWKKAGLTFGTAVNSILNEMTEAVKKTDWEKVGKDIGDFISGIDWTTVLGNVGELIWAAINAAIEAWKGSFKTAPIETTIVTAILGIKFVGLGAKFGKKLWEILGGGIASSTPTAAEAAGDGGFLAGLAPAALGGLKTIAGKVGTAVGGATGYINQIFQAAGGLTTPLGIFTDSEIVAYMANGWKDFFAGMEPYVSSGLENLKEQFSTGFKEIVDKISHPHGSDETPEVEIPITASDETEAGVKSAQKNLDSLPNETNPDILATDNTKSGVDSANKSLDKITPERMTNIVLQMNKKKWDEKYAELEELCKNKEIRQKLGLDTSQAEKDQAQYEKDAQDTRKHPPVKAKFGLDTSNADTQRAEYASNVIKKGAAIIARFGLNTESATKTRANYKANVLKSIIMARFGLNTSSATETRKRYRASVARSSIIARLGVNTRLATETRRTYSRNVANSKMLTQLGISTGARTIRGIISGMTNGWSLGIAIAVSTGWKVFRALISMLVSGWSLSVNAKIGRVTIDYIPVISVTGKIRSTTMASGGMYKGGRWQPVTAAASGGTFSTGQFFLAREAGPELVGTIGGSTAVMNNNQIVSSVSAGVYRAVCAAMSRMGSGKQTPVFNVYVGGKKITDVVIEEVNNRTMSTGQCPILT